MANKQGTTPRASLQAVLQQDADWVREMIRRRVQEVLEQEMTELLGVGKSERRSSRSGYRAGYYERTLVTRVGRIELRVPQDREGRLSTSVFERYQRSEKALVAAMAEMYFRGVSTRKVKAVTEELCGHSVSPGTRWGCWWRTAGSATATGGWGRWGSWSTGRTRTARRSSGARGTGCWRRS